MVERSDRAQVTTSASMPSAASCSAALSATLTVFE